MILELHHATEPFPLSGVQMIYLDPPFYSDRNYVGESGSFGDKWDSLEAYQDFMTQILTNCYDVMNIKGAIFVHCDYHASHYIKIILDSIFGYENFANEIKVRRQPKNMNNMTWRLNTTLDSIFLYWKGEHGTFNIKPSIPTDTSVERWATIYAGGSGGPMEFGGQLYYPPIGRHFMWSQEHITDAFSKGNIRITASGRVEYRIQHNSIALGDYWHDIPAYSFVDGYPTAKSVELLRRLILMVTKEGEVVFDPMCGSGTMLIAAKLTNRQGIGYDLNPDAITLALKRLDEPIEEKMV